MASPDWQRSWDLFFEALDQPEAERAAFLERACGSDTALRDDVAGLLAAHERADAILDAPPALMAGGEETASLVGTHVGRYRIVREIGSGGMGTVYEAEQESPVRRRVALKLVKLGMDTREVVRRFEAERQALALMSHSNIARVYDAGATAEGRPYFVMELVEGVPLTTYCDERRLTIRERLRLMMAVCDGVQHAHHKGVIHRDLKPSNVLVTLEGEVAVPKIIDFGVAKAMTQRLSGETLQTQLGLLLGTPEYMSPEQFHPDGVDVDTRTDIWGLCVLLYELLTGAVPFDARAWRRGGYAEMQRLVQQTEPERPGARFARFDAQRAFAVAHARGTHPRELARTLRGDLGWIAMQGLARERSERYATAGDLAADLRRYLDGQPVRARPPTLAYRARKFVQRHRAGVAIAAAIFVLLVATAATMTVQSIRLQRALVVAEEQRTRAEQVSTFLVDLLKEPDPRESRGEKLTVREVLDAGAEKIATGLETQPAVKAELLVTMANVYRELGLYERARTLLQSAIDLLRRTPGSDPVRAGSALVSLGEISHDEGKLDEAGARYAEALAILRAQPLPTDALATALRDTATLHLDRAEVSQAVAPATESLALFERRVGRDHRETAQTYFVLGRAYMQQGDYANADRHFREGVDIQGRVFGPDSYSTAAGRNAYANFLRHAGRYEEAAGVLEATLGIYERHLGENHAYTAINCLNLAQALHASGRYAAAETYATRAVEVLKRELGPENALVPSAEIALASLWMMQGRYGEAEMLMRQVLALDRKLASGDSKIAATLFWIGALQREVGRYEESAATLREVAEMRTRALGPAHDSVAAARAELGRTLTVSGEAAVARPMLAEALEMHREKLGEAHPRVAANRVALAAAEQALGHAAEARRLYEEGLAAQRSSLRPGHPETARALMGLAQLERAAGHAAEAEKHYREALSVRRAGLPAEHPDIAFTASELAELLCHQGRREEGEGLQAEADRIARRALSAAHPQAAVVRSRSRVCQPG